MEKLKIGFGFKKEKPKTEIKESEKTKTFSSQEIARDLVGLHNAPPPENTSYETLKKAYENAKSRGRMLDAAYWGKKIKDSKKSGSSETKRKEKQESETEKTFKPAPVSNIGEVEISSPPKPSELPEQKVPASRKEPVVGENIPITIIPEKQRQEKEKNKTNLKLDKSEADPFNIKVPHRIGEIRLKIAMLKSEIEKSKNTEYREKREVGVIEQTKIEKQYEAKRKNLEEEIKVLEKEKETLEKKLKLPDQNLYERTNKKFETIKTGLRSKLNEWKKEKDTAELILAEESVLGAIINYNELLEKYSKKWNEDPEAVASLRYQGKLERILIAFNL